MVFLFVLKKNLCWKKDTGSVSKDLWLERQDEETQSEEGEGVCWCNAGSSAGLQGQRVCGLQGQPQDCEERGGEGKWSNIYVNSHYFLGVPNVNNNVNTLLKYAHILPLKLVHVKCYRVQQCARH